MPTITLQITNCKDCPLCEYDSKFQRYDCGYYPHSFLLGKDYDNEVETETLKVLNWENGKPIGCPAIDDSTNNSYIYVSCSTCYYNHNNICQSDFLGDNPRNIENPKMKHLCVAWIKRT